MVRSDESSRSTLHMARIHIPALMQDLTRVPIVDVDIPVNETRTVGQLLDALNILYPGIKERFVYHGDLLPGIAVFVDQQQGFMKLQEKVGPKSHVHFLPPIVGG